MNEKHLFFEKQKKKAVNIEIKKRKFSELLTENVESNNFEEKNIKHQRYDEIWKELKEKVLPKGNIFVSEKEYAEIHCFFYSIY